MEEETTTNNNRWRVLGSTVVLAFLAVGVWWNFYIPSVGKGGICLAVGATLMPLFWEKVAIVGKMSWILMLFVLLGVEYRAIDKEHFDSVEAEQVQRTAENLQFQSIADGIQKQIQQSEVQFQATISSLESTLKTSEQTLTNTRPYAAMNYQGIFLVGLILPTEGADRMFNYHYTNDGNDAAYHVTFLAQTYVRKPADLDTQKEIAKEFDDKWESSKLMELPNNIFPHEATMITFRSHVFTESEITGMLHVVEPPPGMFGMRPELNLYVISRFRWTDQTGTWASDRCFFLQDLMHGDILTVDCEVHNQFRYRTK